MLRLSEEAAELVLITLQQTMEITLIFLVVVKAAKSISTMSTLLLAKLLQLSLVVKERTSQFLHIQYIFRIFNVIKGKTVDMEETLI